MNIGIDAHMLGHHETGNETYILELVRALAIFSGKHRFFIYTEKPDAVPDEVQRAPQMQVVPITTRSGLTRLLHEFPQRAAQNQLDVLHISYTAPLWLPATTALVVSIHDISFEDHPEWFPRKLRTMLKVSVPRSARRAQRILTDSDCAKSDLTRVYDLPEEKIQVTPYAAEARFHPFADESALREVRAKYKTSDAFVLTVANLQPRKNLERLIRAFAQAKRKYALPHKLVIVGQNLWLADPVLAEAAALGEAVVMTGYVPASDLPLLYNAADVFCYPSLYEGFGLPVLEAMACGTPVITSNVSSLPEIAGDAARLINPYETEGIGRALGEICTDPAARRALRERGLVQAARYSWERTARQTIEGYAHAYRQLSNQKLRKV